MRNIILAILVFISCLGYCQTTIYPTGRVGIGTTAPLSKLDIVGSQSSNSTTLTGSAILDGNHNTIFVNSSAIGTSIVLPTATTCLGREYTIKNINSTGSVIITPDGTEKIDGYNNIIFSVINQSATIKSDGSNWYIVKSVQTRENPHATISSNVTQTVAAINIAYPVFFENVDDIQGMYRQSGTVTFTGSSPVVVNWTTHGLDTGAVIRFRTTGTMPSGLDTGVNYFIIKTNFTANSFQVSTSYNGAAVNTTTAGSGTQSAFCISRLYTREPGDYYVFVSAIIKSTTNTDANFDLWFSQGDAVNVGGTNIPNSNTNITLVTNNESKILAVGINIELEAGAFFKCMYHGANNSFSILATPAATNPTRPSCPSVIITCDKIGR
jgi:hypothetical protein